MRATGGQRAADEDTEAAAAAEGSADPQLALVVYDGETTRVVSLVPGAALTVGRDEGADLMLNDRQVSRAHVRLRVRPGALVVEDLGSRNGTRVDGSVIHGESRAVTVGTTISVGGCYLVVASEPSRASPRDAPAGDAALPAVADAEMSRVYAEGRRVAASAATVLITGETGVGKDVLARQIHAWSGRAGPFVRLNCAAVPEPLLESELFGHERGAFTGAVERRLGVFERAAGGTLFLDEIGDMPVAAQVKLLNVLESRSFRRVGGSAEIATDARVVCATHRDLAQRIQSGEFRPDLYYRVGAFDIRIPPLRERPADLVILARDLVRRLSTDMGRSEPALSPGVLDSLLEYEWPGNVRELRNAIERALVLSRDGLLRLEDFPATVRAAASHGARGEGVTGESLAPGAPAARAEHRLRDRVQELERRSILTALAAEQGNRTRAAARLGMPRRTLVAKLARYRDEPGVRPDPPPRRRPG